MKKKFAFLLMGTHYDPQTDRASFETPKQVTYIYTVKDPQEAYAKVAELKEAGVGAIELCGAFGEGMARRIIDMTEGKIAVGFVVHLPEQDEIFARFFQK